MLLDIPVLTNWYNSLLQSDFPALVMSGLIAILVTVIINFGGGKWKTRKLKQRVATMFVFELQTIDNLLAKMQSENQMRIEARNSLPSGFTLKLELLFLDMPTTVFETQSRELPVLDKGMVKKILKIYYLLPIYRDSALGLSQAAISSPPNPNVLNPRSDEYFSCIAQLRQACSEALPDLKEISGTKEYGFLGLEGIDFAKTPSSEWPKTY